MLVVTNSAMAACDINIDTLQGIADKFEVVKTQYDIDSQLLIGIGSNMKDEPRRQQLWEQYGGVAGRKKADDAVAAFEQRLKSIMARCK